MDGMLIELAVIAFVVRTKTYIIRPLQLLFHIHDVFFRQAQLDEDDSIGFVSMDDFFGELMADDGFDSYQEFSFLVQQGDVWRVSFPTEISSDVFHLFQ